MIGRLNGFVTVILVALVPLLLLCVSLVAAASLLLLKWRKTHELCQVSLLKAQSTAAIRVNELFDLNPQARQLRFELAAAEAALAASPAGGPVAVAAAQANLEAVVTRQTVLRSRQEWIKTRAVFDPSHDLLDFENELKKETGVIPTRLDRVRLRVRERPASSLTPDHDPVPGFSRLQALSGTWSIVPDPVFPAWLRKFIPRLARLKGRCSATLIQKGDRWNAALGEGKSSWNY